MPVRLLGLAQFGIVDTEAFRVNVPNIRRQPINGEAPQYGVENFIWVAPDSNDLKPGKPGIETGSLRIQGVSAALFNVPDLMFEGYACQSVCLRASQFSRHSASKYLDLPQKSGKQSITQRSKSH